MKPVDVAYFNWIIDVPIGLVCEILKEAQSSDNVLDSAILIKLLIYRM